MIDDLLRLSALGVLRLTIRNTGRIDRRTLARLPSEVFINGVPQPTTGSPDGDGTREFAAAGESPHGADADVQEKGDLLDAQCQLVSRDADGS